MSGHFIVIEGPDGCGSSKQTMLLIERLEREGHDVVSTHEPTKGEYGQIIRNMLRKAQHDTQDESEVNHEELQRHFALDRREHLDTVVLPAMNEGKVVVSDRYVPSSFVYGEAAGVLSVLLHEWNDDFPKPDVSIVLLPPFRVAMERLGRRENRDAYEGKEFQREIHAGYKKWAEENPETVVIDSSQTKKQTADEIWESVQNVLISS